MLNLKTFAAVGVLASTALIAGGAGYYVSRATMTAQVALSCPAPIATVPGPELPHALPNGPTINATKGTTY